MIALTVGLLALAAVVVLFVQWASEREPRPYDHEEDEL